jgi:hypothetical protein
MSSKKHQNVLKVKRDRELYFNEEYLVRFVTGKEIFVYVKVEHGVNEKCNHQEAEDIAKKQYPGLDVIRVDYC